MDGEHRERRFRPSAARGIGLFLVYFAIQLVIGFIALVWIAVDFVIAGGDPADNQAFTALIEGSTATLGLVGALGGSLLFSMGLLWRYRGASGPEFRRTVGLVRGAPRDTFVGAAIGLAIAASYLLIATTFVPLSPSDPVGPVTQMAQSPGPEREAWTLLALVGPLLEEFVFRGVLLASLLASWGAVWATVVSTIVFVGMHYTEFVAYWPAAIALTAISLGASVVRLRSGSLEPAVAAHFAYNLVMVVAVHAG